MIAGASGSGKSTLLHLLGLLDDATTGSVIIGCEEADILNFVLTYAFGWIYNKLC